MSELDLRNCPDVQALSGVPKSVPLNFGVLPIEELADGSLIIAFPHGCDPQLIDEVRFAIGKRIKAVFSQPELIEELARQLYGSMETGAVLAASVAVGKFDSAAAEVSDADAVQVFQRIMKEAMRARASDIHFEPLKELFRVRFRIDGVLHDVERLPSGLQGPVVSHIKVAAGLDITEKRVPQDGRIEFGGENDLRVSIMPTNHGESAVLRILQRGLRSFRLEELGLSPAHRQIVNDVLAVQDGFIVVTGPTGSGKSTSLYAYLRELADPTLKIITVEDPVEYITEGFTQVPVNAKHGTDFSTALRAILRHDPDVVLIGEIRDKETARIALQAALTGHQVFSTLHTNDAPSAVGRLLNLGVEPFLVNAALTAVVAQRLVRKICEKCKETYPAKEAEKRLMERVGLEAPTQLYRGKGCPACYGTGYRGRMGIFEMIMVTSEIQKLILKRATAGAIRDEARKSGMNGMAHDGYWKAMEGRTTSEEIIRVVS